MQTKIDIIFGSLSYDGGFTDLSFDGGGGGSKCPPPIFICENNRKGNKIIYLSICKGH